MVTAADQKNLSSTASTVSGGSSHKPVMGGRKSRSAKKSKKSKSSKKGRSMKRKGGKSSKR
jgi:hypothetical protein